MTFTRLKTAIQKVDVKEFENLITELKDSIEPNEREIITTESEASIPMGKKKMTKEEHKGLLHYILDTNNICLLQAFLTIPNIDLNLKYTCKTTTIIAKHSFFVPNGNGNPFTVNKSPEEYAEKKRTIRDYLIAYKTQLKNKKEEKTSESSPTAGMKRKRAGE